jgi:hypothetical protein
MRSVPIRVLLAELLEKEVRTCFKKTIRRRFALISTASTRSAYFFRYADFDAILLARTESARRFQNLRVLVGKGRHPSTLALGDFR